MAAHHGTDGHRYIYIQYCKSVSLSRFILKPLDIENIRITLTIKRNLDFFLGTTVCSSVAIHSPPLFPGFPAALEKYVCVCRGWTLLKVDAIYTFFIRVTYVHPHIGIFIRQSVSQEGPAKS